MSDNNNEVKEEAQITKGANDNLFMTNDANSKKSFNKLGTHCVYKLLTNKDKSLKELASEFGGNADKPRSVLAKVLDCDGSLLNDERFIKAHLNVKVIKVDKAGNLENPVSFLPFTYEDLISVDKFKKSATREYFRRSKFLFVVFREDQDGNYRLEQSLVWRMPPKWIKTYVKDVWEVTHKHITQGHIIGEVLDNGDTTTSFPGIQYNGHIFISKNSIADKHVCKLPKADILTGTEEYARQSFWLTRYSLRLILGYEERALSEYEEKLTYFVPEETAEVTIHSRIQTIHEVTGEEALGEEDEAPMIEEVVTRENINTIETDYSRRALRKILREKDKEVIQSKVEEEIKNETNEDVKVALQARNDYFDFAQYVMDTVLRYEGQTMDSLADIFGLDKNGRGIKRDVLEAILKTHGDLMNDERWDLGHLNIKTLLLDTENTPENPMSFPVFDFNRIAEEDFVNSNTRKVFKRTNFIFVVYRKNINGDIYIHDTMLFNLHSDKMQFIKESYSKTREVLLEGNVVKEVNGKRRTTNFPGTDFNKVCFVAAHAQTSSDTNPLPKTDAVTGENEYTKQSFWFTRDFVKTILGFNG